MALKQAKGAKTLTNLAYETTYGTLPTTGKWYRLPFNKNALTGKQNLIESNTITGRRDAVQPGIGQMDASGQLDLPLDARNIGLILKAILGKVTTVAGTTTEGKAPTSYTHTFKVGDEVPSLVLEKCFPDIGLYYQYLGVKASKFSLTAQTGNNETTYTMDTMAADEVEATATAAKTPTQLALTRFNNFNATVKEGGTVLGVCRKMQLDIDNGLDGDTFVLNGKHTRPSINEGIIKVTGNIECLFTDNTQLEKAINSTTTSLELGFTFGDYALNFLIPELNFARATPSIDGPKGILITLDYQAFHEKDANDSIIIATLKNDVASY